MYEFLKAIAVRQVPVEQNPVGGKNWIPHYYYDDVLHVKSNQSFLIYSPKPVSKRPPVKTRLIRRSTQPPVSSKPGRSYYYCSTEQRMLLLCIFVEPKYSFCLA